MAKQQGRCLICGKNARVYAMGKDWVWLCFACARGLVQLQMPQGTKCAQQKTKRITQKTKQNLLKKIRPPKEDNLADINVSEAIARSFAMSSTMAFTKEQIETDKDVAVVRNKQTKPIIMTAEQIKSVFYITKTGRKIKVFDTDIAGALECGGSVTITAIGVLEDDSGII